MGKEFKAKKRKLPSWMVESKYQTSEQSLFLNITTEILEFSSLMMSCVLLMRKRWSLTSGLNWDVEGRP